MIILKYTVAPEINYYDLVYCTVGHSLFLKFSYFFLHTKPQSLFTIRLKYG